MSVLDLIQQHLDPSQIQALSQQIGADPAQTQTAVQAALPMMLGGMAQTAQQPNGAGAITGAMQQHEGLLGGILGGGGGGGLGSILGGALGGALGGGGGGGGGLGGILGQVLGHQQPAVENGVQQASGLDSTQVRKLLMLLAPIVLAALARHRQQAATPASPQSADANGDGIPDVLQQEAQKAREQAPPHIGGIVGKILDAATRH